eukprot:1158363-Pelagomonas_calceolata.AAC.4
MPQAVFHTVFHKGCVTTCSLHYITLAVAAELAGSGKEAWSALGMPSSPFHELPDLPELVRKDLYTSLDLLLALAGHLGPVSAEVTESPVRTHMHTHVHTAQELPCSWRGHVCVLSVIVLCQASRRIQAVLLLVLEVHHDLLAGSTVMRIV